MLPYDCAPVPGALQIPAPDRGSGIRSMQRVLPVDVQPAALFDCFDAAVSTTFCPMSCEAPRATREHFEAELTLARLDEMAMVNVGSSPIDVYRSRAHIGHAGSAWYLVKFQLEGEVLVRQREREAHLRPGDFVMCSTAEPY